MALTTEQQRILNEHNPLFRESGLTSYLSTAHSGAAVAATALANAATAQGTANTALADAATGIADAATAQGTANTALADAATGIADAATAQGTANTALADAATGIADAATAQGTANTALADAATAIGDAATAQGAANAAQGTANSAYSAVLPTETAGGAIGANRLITPDLGGGSTKMLEALLNSTSVIGINSEAAAKVDTNPMATGYFGRQTGVSADAIGMGRPVKSSFGGRITELVDAANAGNAMVGPTPGGDGGIINYANMPLGIALSDLVSSDAGDTAIPVTIWYTVFAAPGTLLQLVTATDAADGTTPVALPADLYEVFAIITGAAHGGTISMRVAGPADYVTIPAGAAASYHMIPVAAANQRSFGNAPQIVSSGASVRRLGMIGLAAADGTTPEYAVAALTGTAAALGPTPFHRVEYLLTALLENGQNATLLTPPVEDPERRVGKSVGAALVGGVDVLFNLQP
jgi:hypothetical protein